MDRLQQMKRAERGRKLIQTIKHQMEMMQCICHTGFMMDNASFRMMLKNNDHIQKRWDQLQSRKFKLERFVWNNA